MISINSYRCTTILNIRNSIHHKCYHSLKNATTNSSKSLLKNNVRNKTQTTYHPSQQQNAMLQQRKRMMSSSPSHPKKEKQGIFQWWLSEKVIPPRYTFSWYAEMVLLCTVFGITGTSTMVLVRPAVSNILGLKGSFKEGPWSYRISSLVIMTPIYATLLVLVGTIFGRHVYFRHFAVKMFSRFGVPPSSMDKTFLERSKTFRKW